MEVFTLTRTVQTLPVLRDPDDLTRPGDELYQNKDGRTLVVRRCLFGGAFVLSNYDGSLYWLDQSDLRWAAQTGILVDARGAHVLTPRHVQILTEGSPAGVSA